MKDDVPTGTIIINKQGEFLDKVTALDSVGGWISHLFQYVSGSPERCLLLRYYALEDVKSADGEGEDYYEKRRAGGNHYDGRYWYCKGIRTSAWVNTM